jgi:hypothetical protein
MRHDIRHPALSALAALAVLSGPAAVAQTSPGTPSAPQVQQSPAGIPYISGGAGEEERSSMAARASEFPLKVVLSQSVGEYVVADKLSVVTPQGELLLVRDAGPVVMMRLQPGTYTLEATWKGRTERRTVRVGNGAETVNWRLEG